MKNANYKLDLKMGVDHTDDLVKSDDGLWRYKKRRYDVRLINPTAPDGEVIS